MQLRIISTIALFIAVFFMALPLAASAQSLPEITLFSAKDPAKSDHSVLIHWKAESITEDTNILLEMECIPGSINFTTSFENYPICEKGGVWTWHGENEGSITVTPVCNAKAVKVPFVLTLWKDSVATSQWTEVVTFPPTANGAHCALNNVAVPAQADTSALRLEIVSLLQKLFEELRVLKGR